MIIETAAPSISYVVEEEFVRSLKKLPWQHPIEEWHRLGVKHLNIKRGVGRHPLVFVQIDRWSFVIKELGIDGARRELENYKEMLKREIHTLTPVGYVVREEEAISVKTRAGIAHERNLAAHSVTLLQDRVLPDSLLYRRAFKPENRKRIWDAIVDLFIELHCNGVYWGDASLANTLVKFLKVDIPYVGKKTKLKALIADAETVEIHDAISDSLRQADLDFFFESMEWINEDLRASGIMLDEIATSEEKIYLQSQYERLFEVAQKEREFDRKSGLTLKRYLGSVRDAAYLTTLEKHITEHKWYLSERVRGEATFPAAAQDWLHNVFIPVCELFQQEGVLKLFPGKTASELYVEVMTHKYYLSQAEGGDVGIIRAMRAYASQFGAGEHRESFWDQLANKLRDLLGVSGRILLGVVQ